MKNNKKITLAILTLIVALTSACTKVEVKNGISDTAIKSNPANSLYVKSINAICKAPGSQMPCWNK
jgi:hypothetical protein